MHEKSAWGTLGDMRFRFLILGLALSIPSAFSTSFYERPFPETLKNSSIMARGKIGKSAVDWSTLSDGSKHIFTFTDLEVTEVLKGNLKPGPIRMREMGGEKDGVGMVISGTAEFARGEDVVVFLAEPSPGTNDPSYPLQGMMMGKFMVEKGEDGKEYLRGPALGASVQPSLRGEHAGHDHGGNGPQTQWSLDAVRELIRQQAEEPAAAETTASVAPKKPGGDGLLKSRSKPLSNEGASHEHEGQDPAVPKNPTRFPRAGVVLLGVIAGVFFFLRSKKRRK